MLALETRYGRAAVVAALRAEAAALRNRMTGGATTADAAGAIEQGAAVRLARALSPSLRTVINATGVIVHTTLGRAPLSRRAAERAAALAARYTNLEYDLAEGARGRRDVHANHLICRLTGAASSVVVNNNAAAALIVLAALAHGREVIVSRGELVEIGGGFRVPDVMAQSGAILREVGTTNRTRAADYAAAIGERTALILRVHPSNFRITGFTERPSLDELVALGRRFHLPVAEDLGSGWLGTGSDRPAAPGDEPVVSRSIEAGADVVMFSGDKLLGGPQAGIIAGSESAVSAIRTHPLMRALRVDKLTYAALEATLEDHVTGHAGATVPVARMMALTPDEIEPRANALADAAGAAGFDASVIDGASTIGGGSAPGSALPTRLVALSHPSLTAAAIAARLRAGEPPVIVRIENDRVLLDLRAVFEDEDDLLIAALRNLEGRT